MRALIDTPAFRWWVEGNRVLPAKARRMVETGENECLLSVASVWELAIKANLGKLKLATSVQRHVVEQMSANAFVLLNIDIAHVGQVEKLPPHHGDPFDRLLIAQALIEDIPIIAADPVFGRYGVKRIWS
jgi:PIN domain nuclease of toxin-antitoxin system